MKRSLATLAAISVAGLIASGCGPNPFGAGQGGLSLFANIGKAMQKPSAINDEQNSKTSTKSVVSEGSGVAKRLAKLSSAAATPLWLVDHNIEAVAGTAGTYKYWQQVASKPGEEDPENLWTGRGEVIFTYSGTTAPSLTSIDTALITGVQSFTFVGKVDKTWKYEIDSVSIGVEFNSADIHDIKPGHVWAWGKNISATVDQGQGDTAFFTLDSLDDVNHIQFGEGHFLDLHTGSDNSGESYAFNFEIEVHFKNLLEPGKPYQHWQDNEGVVKFALPWGKNNTDSLYFEVNFFPNYARSGTIKDDNGTIRVRFTHNEKSGAGDVIYYNEEGVEVSRE